MLTAEQKAERVNYIGGSEVAAVLGMSRWSTPLSVWAEKTGQIVREERGAFHQRLGHKLEQTVAELFMEETGKKLNRVNETLFHPRYPFLGANLDRRVVGERAIFEAKTAAAWKAKEWADAEVPREYILQAMHYLAVTGMDRVYIGVLLGNQDFHIKTIERMEVLAALDDMVAREVAFWQDFVVPKVMPTLITAGDRDTLEALFPVGQSGPPLVLDDKANAIAESLDGMSADLKGLERQIEQAKNELLAMLGTHEAGTTGAWDILWMNTITKRFDVEAFKKAHPALYDQFRKPNTARRFIIKTSTTEE